MQHLFNAESIKLFNRAKDPFNWIAAQEAVNEEGVLTVQGHGNEKVIANDLGAERVLMNAQDLADYIVASGKWSKDMPIMLKACNVAVGENSIAQGLSRILNTQVIGPNGYWFNNLNGSYEFKYWFSNLADKSRPIPYRTFRSGVEVK